MIFKFVLFHCGTFDVSAVARFAKKNCLVEEGLRLGLFTLRQKIRSDAIVFAPITFVCVLVSNGSLLNGLNGAYRR